MERLSYLIVAVLLGGSGLSAKTLLYPVPAPMQSNHFMIAVDGQESPVSHAAMTYYFSGFSVEGGAQVSITAEADDYWSRGVEVQPWRWGIRPAVHGRTITFFLPHAMKLSVTRPGDHAAGAEMLFLFADAPEPNAPRPGDAKIRYFGPGVYRENIDVRSGETVYLAPGAVIFGALNLWGVEHVKVLGRGTIIYDGPQNPSHDEGWMHKPNWHVIGMDHARDVQVSGLTFVVRSRTWMIQMLSSFRVTFENIKVIGGCPGNANQDGMDWLGGGDTVIRDCFFRASDDIFAIYGNWLGYEQQAITTPGETVSNILVEDSVLSTSISNVVRVSWPQKVFDSRNFTMRNTDVIHMGMGGCKVPFGLLEIWADPSGKGMHSGYYFENIRLDNWYSLVQLRQKEPGIRDIQFKGIWALGNPQLVPSVLSGSVSDVELSGVGSVLVTRDNGAAAARILPPEALSGAFHFSGTGTDLEFEAEDRNENETNYHWLFGDGTEGDGRKIRHHFADRQGTEMDGSGRFRVLLHTTDKAHHQAWGAGKVFVTNDLVPALEHYQTKSPLHLTTSSNSTSSVGYSTKGDGVFNVSVDGGYTFYLLGNDTAELLVDGRLIATSPTPKPQVCGMAGNMVQLAIGSLGLAAGTHRVSVNGTHSTGPDGLAVLWSGPMHAIAGL